MFSRASLAESVRSRFVPLVIAMFALGASQAAVAAPEVSFPDDAPERYVLGSNESIDFVVDGEMPAGGDVLALAWSQDERRMVEDFAHTYTEAPWRISPEHLDKLPTGEVQIQLHRRVSGARRTIARLDIEVVAPPPATVSFPDDAPASYRQGSGSHIPFVVDGVIPPDGDVLVLAWSEDEQRMVDSFAHTLTDEPWHIAADHLDVLPAGEVQLQLHRRVPGLERTIAYHALEILPPLPTVGFASSALSTYELGSGVTVDLSVDGHMPSDGVVRLSASADGSAVDAFAYELTDEPWRIGADRLDTLPVGEVELRAERVIPGEETTTATHALSVTAPVAVPGIYFASATPSVYEQGVDGAIEFVVEGELPEGGDVLVIAWSDAEQRMVDEFAHSVTQEPWEVTAERMAMLPDGGTSLQLLMRLPEHDNVRVDHWMTIESPASGDSGDGDSGDGDSGDGDSGDGDSGDGDSGDGDSGDGDSGDGDSGDGDSGDDDVESAGWTSFEKSADTRVVYVSSSEGDDANDGLSPETPVQSIEQGRSLMRSGRPDWLLLKAGDEWWRPTFGPWSGRSENEMAKLGVYGQGSRPVLKGGYLRATTGSPIHHFAVVGVEFYNSGADPHSADYGRFNVDTAILWRRGAEHILFEDLVVRFYRVGIVLEGRNDVIADARIRRCIVTDQYSAGSGHSQGLFSFATEGLLIEENVFDHNGWNPNVSDSERTIFNHNLYLQYYNTDVVLRNNIIARASSHGVHMRPGGLSENNLFLKNPLNMSMGYQSGYTYPSEAKTGTIRRNVVIDTDDIAPDRPRGTGITVLRVKDVLVEENIVAHRVGGSGSILAYSAHSASDGLTLRNNHAWGWGGRDFYFDPDQHVNFSGIANIIDGHRFNGHHYDGSGSVNTQYYDPSRNLDTYLEDELDQTGDMEMFLEIARARPRGVWIQAHSAAAVNNYIRTGFVVMPSYD